MSRRRPSCKKLNFHVVWELHRLMSCFTEIWRRKHFWASGKSILWNFIARTPLHYLSNRIKNNLRSVESWTFLGDSVLIIIVSSIATGSLAGIDHCSFFWTSQHGEFLLVIIFRRGIMKLPHVTVTVTWITWCAYNPGSFFGLPLIIFGLIYRVKEEGYLEISTGFNWSEHSSLGFLH